MNLSTIRALWAVTLLLLAPASYLWPAAGLFAACSTVVIAGLLNYLLSLRSAQFGLYTGASAGLLAVIAGSGAHLPLLQLMLGGALSLAVGYGFGAFRVNLLTEDD